MIQMEGDRLHFRLNKTLLLVSFFLTLAVSVGTVIAVTFSLGFSTGAGSSSLFDGYNGTVASEKQINVTFTNPSVGGQYPAYCIAYAGRADTGNQVVFQVRLNSSALVENETVAILNQTAVVSGLFNQTIAVGNTSGQSGGITLGNSTVNWFNSTNYGRNWTYNGTHISINNSASTILNNTHRIVNESVNISQNVVTALNLFNSSVQIGNQTAIEGISVGNDSYNLWNSTNLGINWTINSTGWLVFNNSGFNMISESNAFDVTYRTNKTSTSFNFTYLRGSNSSFYNTTTFAFNDTGYGQSHNLSVVCYGTDGEASWTNDTGTALAKFRIDTRNPTVRNFTQAGIHRISNDSTNPSGQFGNNINITFHVVDNNTLSCGITYVNGNDEVLRNYTGSLLSPGESTICETIFKPTDFITEGNFTVIGGWATDTFNRSTVNRTNIVQQFNVQKLIAGQWNMISLTARNLTMLQLAQAVPNITAITMFNATPGSKVHLQWDLGSSLNESLTINTTHNATFVFIRANSPNIWFVQNWTNMTTRGSANEVPVWMTNSSIRGDNVIPVLGNVSINQTLYACLGYTGGYAGTATSASRQVYGTAFGCNATFQNVSSVSWWDAANARYCSATKGSERTSCREYSVTNLTFQQGESVWMRMGNLTGNRTLNLTDLYGPRIGAGDGS